MGTGDDPRQARATRRFERDELAKLTRDAGGEFVREWAEPPLAAGSQPSVLPVTSRTATLHDPMTMALLAEVARTSEIEPEKIEQAQAADLAIEEPPAHPRIKRR